MAVGKGNQSRAHLLGIPRIIGGFVERAVNDGRHQQDADQYWADKTPCDLPVQSGHMTCHLEDVLRESINWMAHIFIGRQHATIVQ